MFWLKQNQKRPPKEMRVLDLCFIGEQDGPPERVLKERLIVFFSSATKVCSKLTWQKLIMVTIIHIPELHFVGEQDGPPEKILKERLIIFLRHDKSVKKAYLAKVANGREWQKKWRSVLDEQLN